MKRWHRCSILFDEFFGIIGIIFEKNSIKLAPKVQEIRNAKLKPLVAEISQTKIITGLRLKI
jgi:hypothetical protein